MMSVQVDESLLRTCLKKGWVEVLADTSLFVTIHGIESARKSKPLYKKEGYLHAEHAIYGGSTINKGILFNKLSTFKIYMRLLRIRKCKGCGSVRIGDGEGKFEITEKYFVRQCKCGYSLKGGTLIERH